MAHETRATRQGKDDERSDSKGVNASGKSCSSTSTREATNTSSATRRSERIENRTPRKPEAKQDDPSPLRRSERGKKQSLSGSKKSDKSGSPSSSKKKKLKTVRQLTLETEEIDTNEKRLPRKRMNARTYDPFFQLNLKKADVAVESKAKLSQDSGSKNDDVGKLCSQVKLVKSAKEDADQIEEQKLNEPNASDGQPPKQGDCMEEPDISIHDCTSVPSLKLSGQPNEISGREQDKLMPELFSVDNKTSGDDNLKSCFKTSSYKRKRHTEDMNSAASEVVPDKNNSDADSIHSNGCTQDCLEERGATCSKRPRTNVHDSQKSLHLLLKPEIAKLCEILQLPEDVKDMVERFLEYVMNNHRVFQEPATILQAFQISLCWTAASLLKHKIDHKKSLALAKQHLHFDCKEEEADFVYSMLRCLKKTFLRNIGDFKLIGCPTSQLLVKDHNENQLHATPLKPTLGYAFTDDEILSNLGLAQKDFCKSVKDIEKKCDKQMKRLVQRQQDEKEDFERKYAEEKARLEHKKKTEAAVIRLHSNSSIRTDKLKLLDIEYAKKNEELKFETEAHRKDLMEMQLMARNKLKDKETRWVEGVKSRAAVELVYKPPSVETGHNHNRPASVVSWFEDQAQREQTMQDGEVPLEIPGTLRSDEDEQVLPALQTVSRPPPDGVSSTKLQGEVPLRMPKDVGLDVSLINYSPAHTHSLEERIPNVEVALGMPEVSSSSDMNITFHNPSSEEPYVDGAVLQVPHRDESSLGTPENVALADPLSTGVKSCTHDEVLLEIPETPYDAMDAMTSQNAAGIKLLDGTACVVTRDPLSDKMAAVDQQNGEEEILSEQVEVCSAGLRQEEIQVCRNAAEQVYESSNKTDIATQQHGEFSSMNLDTSPVVVVVGSETGSFQDGEVLVDKAADNEDSQSSGKMARNMQDRLVCTVDKDPIPEALSGVAVTLGEQVEGCNAAPQQYVENLQEVFQAECSVSTQPTALEDGVPQNQNQNAFQQVEVSPGVAHNAVSAQSNGAPVMEHVLPAEIPLDGSVTHVSGSGTMPTTSASGSHPAHTSSLSQIPQLSFQDPLQYELERIRKEAEKTTTTHKDMNQQMRLDFEKEIEKAIAKIRRKYEIKTQELKTDFFAKKEELDSNYNKVLMNKILADAFRSKCMDFSSSTTPDSTSTFMQQLLHLSAQPTAERPSIVDGVFFTATPRAPQSPTTACPPAAGLRGASPHPPAQSTTERPSIVAARSSFPCPPGFSQTTAAPGPPATLPHGTSPHILLQPTIQRPSLVAAGIPPSRPPGSLQTTAAGPRGTPPRPQAVHHSQSLSSGTSSRPPHISSISPAANNLQAGSEIRAPAPHLQPFRSQVSMPAPGLSSLSRGLPSAQVTINPTTTSLPLPSGVSSLSRGLPSAQMPGNPSTAPPLLFSSIASLSHGLSRPQVAVSPSTTSPMLSQHQSRPPPSTLLPSDQNRAQLPETAGLSRPQPIPAVELPMGIEARRSTNATQVSSLPLQTDLGSKSEPPAVADHTRPKCTQTNQASPDEVVCLSDDD